MAKNEKKDIDKKPTKAKISIENVSANSSTLDSGKNSTGIIKDSALSGIPTSTGDQQIQGDNTKLIDPKIIEVLGGFVFDKIAVNNGEHWKLSEDEKATLGELTANVLNKYIGAYVADFPEAFAFIIGAGMIITPRIMEDSKLKKEKKDEIKRKVEQVVKRADEALSDKPNSTVSSNPIVQKQASSSSTRKP